MFHLEFSYLMKNHGYLAYRYHPDIYKGVNQDHFKKANEAYTVLKNPLKRKEYNRKMKIIKSKVHSETRHSSQPGGFWDEGEQFTYKRRPSKARETIDPEIEEELKKWNFDKMFMEFNERPMRSHPGDLKVMEPIIIQKMSRRDIARMKFVLKRREMEKINRNIFKRMRYHKLNLERITENDGIETKSYDQLVEEINKNYKKLEQVDKPLVVYQTEQQIIESKKKQHEEIGSFIKRYIYPIIGIAFLINSLILIGVYYQNKQSERSEHIWEKRRNYMSIARNSEDSSSHVPKNLLSKTKD
jgi:curved DNA-binding protein CbpA